MSGLLPTSLSKWFGEERTRAVVRRRDSADLDLDLDDAQHEREREREREREQDGDENATWDEYNPSLQPPRKRPRNSALSTVSHGGFAVTSTPLHRNHELHVPLQAGPSTHHFQRPLLRLPTGEVPVQHVDTQLQMNGDDGSDSGESTSGYSSVPMLQPHNESDRDSSKPEIGTPKPIRKCELPLKYFNRITNLNKNALFSGPVTPVRSLFSEQGGARACMSARRPSFNASTFGSPHLVDRTLSTDRAINSPFYSGRTQFGGAAAAARSRAPIFPADEARRRVHVAMRPADVAPAPATHKHLSKTARRILDALESFSTPVADAKKIPSVQARRPRPRASAAHAAPHTELMVPTVPDLLRMKLKGRLQDGTVAARTVAAARDDRRRQLKMRVRPSRNATAPRNVDEEERAPSPPHLPEVRLPISSLPKFDFSLPPPPAPVPAPASAPVLVPVPAAAAALTPAAAFRFASPIAVEPAVASDTAPATHSFEFSQPLRTPTPTQPPSSRASFRYSPAGTAARRRADPNKNNGQNNDVAPAPPSPNFDKFKPASGTWECTVCLVRNVPSANRCVACETTRNVPKDATPKPPAASVGFGDRFKMPTSEWECGACMVRNKSSASSCVACTTPKPGSKAPAAPFGSQFRPPPDAWECATCMIRNGLSASKCVACETPKPGQTDAKQPQRSSGFGDIIKKQGERWECSTCLVRNPIDKDACTSCEMPKPGTALSSTRPPASGFTQFKFGLDKANVSSSVATPSTTTTSKFGAAKTDNASTFTFGIKPQSEAAPQNAAAFKFGTTTTTPAPEVIADNGNKQSDKVTIDEQVSEGKEGKSTQPPAFVFGVPAKPSETCAVVQPTFSFGTSTTASAVSDLQKPAGSFKSASNPIVALNSSTSATSLSNSNSRADAPPAETTSSNLQAMPKFNFGTGSSAFGQRPAETPATSCQSQVKPALPIFTATSESFSASSTAAVKPFTFSSAAEPTTNKGLFSFGAKSEPASSGAQPLFSFGGTADPASGNGGPTPAAAPPLNGGFNFTPAPAPSLSFKFGSGAAPVAAQPRQPAVFSFGSAPQVSFRNKLLRLL